MFIKGIAHAAGGVQPGKVIEVSDERGARLIRAGLARSVETLEERGDAERFDEAFAAVETNEAPPE